MHPTKIKILFAIADNHQTIRDIASSLKMSCSGINYHKQQLVKDGYIEKKAFKVTGLKLTDKARNEMAKYGIMRNAVYEVKSKFTSGRA